MLPRRSVLLLTILVSITVLLAGCAGSGKLDTATKTINQWQVTILNREITTDLSSSESVVQYDGEVVDVEYNQQPQEGNVYVLLQMNIEKEESGQGRFSWDQAVLVDADGNEYHRHENDTFLTNYNLTRIKSTDLVFGSNEGFACYEIPADAVNGLTFVYEDGGERIEIRVN